MLKPSEVRSRANKIEEENYMFRVFLKQHADPDELDKQFLELHNELFDGYDCTNCRNCCKEYAAVMTDAELDEIASFLHLSKADFIAEYVKESRDDEYELKDIPCRFLSADNSCQIEKYKPQSCKDYPFTNKPERLWSMLSIIDSTYVCPVVFEIVERLKKEYGYRPR
jgi:Fe-S-cluster containining protein